MRNIRGRFRPVFLSSLFTTLLLSALSCQAASVWQVSKGDNTIYLGGTLHILSPVDYPLPKHWFLKPTWRHSFLLSLLSKHNN